MKKTALFSGTRMKTFSSFALGAAVAALFGSVAVAQAEGNAGPAYGGGDVETGDELGVESTAERLEKSHSELVKEGRSRAQMTDEKIEEYNLRRGRQSGRENAPYKSNEVGYDDPLETNNDLFEDNNKQY